MYIDYVENSIQKIVSLVVISSAQQSSNSLMNAFIRRIKTFQLFVDAIIRTLRIAKRNVLRSFIPNKFLNYCIFYVSGTLLC